MKKGKDVSFPSYSNRQLIAGEMICPFCKDESLELTMWYEWDDPCTYTNTYEASCGRCNFNKEQIDRPPDIHVETIETLRWCNKCNKSMLLNTTRCMHFSSISGYVDSCEATCPVCKKNTVDFPQARN